LADANHSAGRVVENRQDWLIEDGSMTASRVPLVIAAAFGALLAAAGSAPAQTVFDPSDGVIAYDGFRRVQGGDWMALRPLTIVNRGSRVEIAAGTVFSKNIPTAGADMTTILDRHCGN
jgi:hypothetical protein